MFLLRFGSLRDLLVFEVIAVTTDDDGWESAMRRLDSPRTAAAATADGDRRVTTTFGFRSTTFAPTAATLATGRAGITWLCACDDAPCLPGTTFADGCWPDLTDDLDLGVDGSFGASTSSFGVSTSSSGSAVTTTDDDRLGAGTVERGKDESDLSVDQVRADTRIRQCT
jgi:hypothetical protein